MDISQSGAGRIYWREAELAAHWAAGAWTGQTLRTEQDAYYTILYQGRPGGGAGPDFRDAVLARSDGSHVHGDVELHLRPRNWTAHGHEHDARYNNVVLHVVLMGDAGATAPATTLASGGTAPITILGDATRTGILPHAAPVWPCADLRQRLGARRLHALLGVLGQRRLDAKASNFVGRLTAPNGSDGAGTLWSYNDRLLWVTLAEALAYGRDRDALRQAGLRLVSTSTARIPDDEMTQLPRIEQTRLRGLLRLRSRWYIPGPWPALRRQMQHGAPREAAAGLLEELRVPGGGVSSGRAGIVAANVVLPFASALAQHDGQSHEVRRSTAIYGALPGLPSNALTRLMTRQLGLPRLPPGARAQQGLQQIWTEWCREKRCDLCPCARDESHFTG